MHSRTGAWVKWGVTLAVITAGIFPWVPVYGKDSGNDFINHIVFQTENRGFGKETTSIVLSVDDTAEFQSLGTQDFEMRGCMVDKRVNGETDMYPSDIAFTDTEIILTTEPFIIESSKRHFEFDCTDDRLDFTFADISEIICPNVDSFTDEEVEVNGRAVQYHLYSPDQEQPLPLVFYNHGGGCTGYDGVLTDDCFASAWITGDAQEEFPCYVAAVFRESVKDESLKLEDELDAMKKIADDLVKDGKADPNRIYMAGESMGCICTMTFANRYPGFLAAAILMDGGPFEIAEGTDLEESVQQDLASPWSDEELKTLAGSGTAVAVVQGVGDTLSIPIRLATVYRKLAAFGMEAGEEVLWRAYSADLFNELLRSVTKIYHIGDTPADTAVDPVTGEETWQDGLFHNTSRVTGWDPVIREWLPKQELEASPDKYEEEVSSKIQTIVPDPDFTLEDAAGIFQYDETEFTLDYKGTEIAATLAMPRSENPVPMILMCHGYTGSQNHFSSYAEGFATNGVASIRFDFPANGKSGGESTAISLLTEKDVTGFMLDYVETVEGIDKDQIYLCGQSMGGMAAALCAAERQDELKGLILCYPGFPIPQFTREGNVLGTEFDVNDVPETLEIYNYTVGSCFITDALELDVYGEILPSLDLDVLIFHGTTDDMIDLKYSEEAVEVLPSARLVVVEGFGHGFPGFVVADLLPYAIGFIEEHL